MRDLLSRPTRALPLAISLLFICLYGVTVSRYASGYADSDEFILTGNLFSVAHPSGYPLLTLSSWLTQRLFIFLPLVTRANFLASLFQAIFVGLFSAVILRMYQVVTSPKPLRLVHFAAASISSILIGLSTLFWLYGTVIEVGALSNMLVSATLFCAFSWLNARKLGLTTTTYWFYFTFLLYGLCLSHLQVTIILAPLLGMLLLIGQFSLKPLNTSATIHPKIFLVGGFLSLLAFILPNSILFLQNSHRPSVSWYFEQSFTGWRHQVFRQDYQGYFTDEGISRPAYTGGFAHNWLDPQPRYVLLLWEQLGSLAIILLFIGVIHLFSQSKSLFIALVIGAFVAGPLFTGYMGMPNFSSTNLEYQLRLGILSRQFFPGLICLGLLMSWGALSIAQSIESKSNSLSKKNQIIIFSLISLTVMLFLIKRNYPAINQKQNHTISNYAKAMLMDAKPNSVIICSSDISCFSLFEANVVEKIRPDVVVLSKNNKYRKYFLDQNPTYYKLLYTENPFFYANLIAWNLVENRTVYVTNPDTQIIDYVGLDGNPYYLVPQGYLYQIVKSLPSSLKFQPNNYPTLQLLQTPIDPRDHFRRGLKDYFANIHYFNGLLLTKYQKSKEAKAELELSLSLKPDYQDAYTGLSYLHDPQMWYEPPSTQPTAQAYLQVALDALTNNEDLESAYKYLTKATLMAPKQSQIRLELAKLYLNHQYPEYARLELQTILIHDPQNNSAKTLLNQIEK